MQLRYGWLVLIGLLLAGATLGLSFDSTTPSEQKRSLVVSPEVAAPSNGPTRNAMATNAGKRSRASAPADAADPMEDPLVVQCARDYREALQRHLQVLANRQDAHSQQALALLAPSVLAVLAPDGNDDYLTYAAKAYAEARRLAPEAPLLAWLEANNCGRATAGCDPDGAIERLSRLEPNNAAAWLMAMDAAQAQGDVAAVDRYLARAAQADYYDLHFGEIGLLAEAALDEIPPPSSCSAETQGRMLGLERPATDGELATMHAGVAEALNALPAFTAFGPLCRVKDGVLPAESRLPACMAVLSRMAESDTLIAQALGLAFLVQYTAGQPEGAQWRERLRNLRWLIAEGSQQFPYGRESMHSLWAEGEVPTWQARLTASGRWPAPPGWLPHDAHNRALITTGRPPRD